MTAYPTHDRPHTPTLAGDSSLAFLRDPYGFLPRQSRSHNTDVVAMRLMLRPTLCVTGPEAAALFYDRDRFVREGAAPWWLRMTLFGRGGVQGLDGDAHEHRKALFLSLATPERIDALRDLLTERWLDDARKWQALPQLVLYDALRLLLTRTVCEWAGIPLPRGKTDRRTRELTALYADAVPLGTRHRRAYLARFSLERWLGTLIQRVRTGAFRPPEPSAADTIAWYRRPSGELLPPRVAAVELLNVVRPLVAVSVYLTFVAHALHQHPEWRKRVTTNADDVHLFLAEVRRYYPFFPAVAARVREDFQWHGHHFPAGRRVLLDLHGTNHDARAWDAPHEFRPARFRSWRPNPYDFVPQGGGHPGVGHRCPGEPITAALMAVGADMLTRRIDYDVPAQDLEIDTSRVPALPHDGFVISDVRPTSAAG